MEFKPKPPQQPPSGRDPFRKAPKLDEKMEIFALLTKRDSQSVAERMRFSPEAVKLVASVLGSEEEMGLRRCAADSLNKAAGMKVNIQIAFDALTIAVKSKEGLLYVPALNAVMNGILNNCFESAAGSSTGFDILAAGLEGSSTHDALKALISIAKKQMTVPPYVLAMAKDSSRGRTFMDMDVEKLLIESAKNEMRPFLATKPINGVKLHEILVRAEEAGDLGFYTQALNDMTHHGESGIVKENARFALGPGKN